MLILYSTFYHNVLMGFTLLVIWSLGQHHSFNLSQLPGENITQPWRTSGFSLHNVNLYPSMYPFIPWVNRIILAKHLAHGHKCHDRESNPHSDDLTTRTWIWCFKALGNDAYRQHFFRFPIILKQFFVNETIEGVRNLWRSNLRRSYERLTNGKLNWTPIP